MTIFIHPQALCETSHVGEGTRIWAFAHVLSGARIGRDCNVCDGVFIENNVTIGDAVTIKCGVQLWDGLKIGNGVFIGPNATFTNDSFPRSKRHLARYPETVIEDGASIGANATILPGVRIGFAAMIGAGAVITEDVPPRTIMVGNPARAIGYSDAQPVDALNDELPANFRCKFVPLNVHAQGRGHLSVLDASGLPFEPKRMFVVDRVPDGSARGVHAHRQCHQLLLAMSGRLKVVADDGRRAFSISLSSPELALYVPPMIWGMQYDHSENAVLLVLASRPYEIEDYIRDYSAFHAAAN